MKKYFTKKTLMPSLGAAIGIAIYDYSSDGQIDFLKLIFVFVVTMIFIIATSERL